ILAAMKDYRPWIDPDLRRRFPRLAEDAREKLHASLALLPDPGQAEYLHGRLLNAGPTELPVIETLLRQSHQEAVPRVLAVLEAPQADKDQRFRAACALANSRARDKISRWDAVSGLITEGLVASVLKNPSHYDPLIQSLFPVRHRLIAPLSRTFRDPGKPES